MEAGSLHFPVDYRTFNVVRKEKQSTMAIMDECLDSFAKAAVFCALGGNSVYWKAEIKNEDHDKTT